MMLRKTLTLALAAGTCLAAAQAAMAQQLINISGATLLENFVRGPASTNDYIDVDGNGVAGALGSGSLQQLAGPSSGTGIWTIQYRVVGSVNGFKELTQFGAPTFVTTNDHDTMGILGAPLSPMPSFGGVASAAYNNRVLFISGGFATGAYNASNPGGAPDRAATAGANRALTAAPAGGITIDIAPLDVSTKWATQKVGTPSPTRTPLQAGYGLNPRPSVGKNGETAPNISNPELGGGLSSFLAPLNGRNLFDPANPGVADANTIFDTQLNFAPIAPVVALGTGIQQVTISELQHLFTTGRAATGENFVVSTRDVGSGTRNAFMNCIGIDPSWGNGDNVGGESALASQHNIGAQFMPTNKTSNGGMEATLRNSRLGVGYVGTERGVTGSGSGSWLTGNALEIAAVRNDIYGGTTYVRPTTSNIVHNNTNGWVIGGQAVLATIGDPLAEAVALGGENNGRPAMVNKSAAAYVNNIRKSIAAFVALPGGAESDFMPGELAAFQFLLLNSLDNLHDLSSPTTLGANPDFVLALQNYTLANNVHNNAAFNTFNASSTGRNPTRATGTTYTDGVVGGGNYLTQGGAAATYGAVTEIRNKIFFDFNGDGARTLADAADLVAAWTQRNGGAAWVAPNGVGTGAAACIEILGDANSDGNFTAADVRYWADGNALNAMGKLDRKAGFIAVDNAFGGNFFGVTLATGSAPAPGAARADVIGATGRVARGWAPVGADGVVNARDIDYVFANIRAVGVTSPWTDNSDANSANWDVLTEAVLFDLSCDMNGDLRVNKDDVLEILSILGTQHGDVNLDGTVNSADTTIINANLGQLGLGWAGGDVNGDGITNAADLPAPTCPADFNNDGTRNVSDIFAFLTAWFANNPSADFNGTGGINVSDIFAFLTAWFGGC